MCVCVCVCVGRRRARHVIITSFPRDNAADGMTRRKKGRRRDGERPECLTRACAACAAAAADGSAGAARATYAGRDEREKKSSSFATAAVSRRALVSPEVAYVRDAHDFRPAATASSAFQVYATTSYSVRA